MPMVTILCHSFSLSTSKGIQKLKQGEILQAAFTPAKFAFLIVLFSQLKDYNQFPEILQKQT
jgi:hypothetical protein